MATTGKQYDNDFKFSAVKMFTEKERAITNIATNLGISCDTLQRWVKEFTADKENSFVVESHETR